LKPFVPPLLTWYASYGRKHLPWRRGRDPYRVVVSEFMLQQTQVDRVLPVFEAFLLRFPDIAALAAAPTADVVRAWRGLGYNSRAIRLQNLARAVTSEHGGEIPQDAAMLRALAGVGPYTACAVRAFAFDCDEVAADTNVRRVMHRLLYGVEYPAKATARELDELARRSIPPGGGHDWNSAMMDLGATICTARTPKCLVCPLRDVCAAAPIDVVQLSALAQRYAPKRSPQESIPFERTTRFVRGRIVDRLRELPPHQAISLLDLQRELQPIVDRDEGTFRAIVERLARDGIIEAGERGISLAGAAAHEPRAGTVVKGGLGRRTP
jgi:A/G-specific adenine glycosylase